MSEAPPETEAALIDSTEADSATHAVRSMTFDRWLQLITVSVLLGTAWVIYNGYRLSDEGLKRGALLQSEIAGNVSWEKFRDRQLDFRKTAGQDYKYPSGDQIIDSDYVLLSERLLMAADVVTVINEVDKSWKDKQWAHSFAYEFLAHQDYFLSPEFLDESDGLMSSYCTYRSPVRAWIRIAFESAKDAEASRKISDAEKACEAICSPEEGCT